MCGAHPSRALDSITLNAGGLVLLFVAVIVCDIHMNTSQKQKEVKP